VSGRQLRQATIAECRRRVAEWCGGVDEELLHDSLRKGRELDRECQELCELLYPLLDRIVNAAEAVSLERFNAVGSDHGRFILRISKTAQTLLMRQGWPSRRSTSKSDQQSARLALLETFDQVGVDTRRPTRNELAALSILAGNWNDYAIKRGDDITPAAAIEAEARNLDHAARKLGRKLLSRVSIKPTKRNGVRAVGSKRA
jgi:hypothetical protein